VIVSTPACQAFVNNPSPMPIQDALVSFKFAFAVCEEAKPGHVSIRTSRASEPKLYRP